MKKKSFKLLVLNLVTLTTIYGNIFSAQFTTLVDDEIKPWSQQL